MNKGPWVGCLGDLYGDDSFTIPSYRGDYVLNHPDPGIKKTSLISWFGGNLEGRCLQTRDGLVVAGLKDSL